MPNKFFQVSYHFSMIFIKFFKITYFKVFQVYPHFSRSSGNPALSRYQALENILICGIYSIKARPTAQYLLLPLSEKR